jgi:hypothetical protein
MTHAEHSTKARVATPCTSLHITFGGRCLNCGYEPARMSGFTPTKFSTIEDKEKFFNHFKRFVSKGFKRTMFPKWFYTRLSMTFGHIAHYNIDGFYEVWFSTRERRMDFVCRIIGSCPYGDPAFTYVDVERAIRGWMRQHLLSTNID